MLCQGVNARPSWPKTIPFSRNGVVARVAGASIGGQDGVHAVPNSLVDDRQVFGQVPLLFVAKFAQVQYGASRAQEKVLVSVIAGYTAQAYALDARIQRDAFTSLSIEVATVDSFQGRETDVTIFSITLSNPTEFLGFMRSANRLNVALSRPRDLLVVVGDQLFCYNVTGANPFVKVIDHMEANPLSCETQNVS